MLLYHLDLKYSMYRPKYLRSLFKRLRKNGYDGIVVEIDNKLRFPSHPEFASRDALSPEEWYGLVRDAKNMGMIVYPLIQTLGHMEHIVFPGGPFNHLCEIPGERYMVCPSKEATTAFVKDLIRDVYAIFDRPRRIHLGGDECLLLGSCPLCYGKQPHELMGHYLHELADYAIKMDMKPEFWADMFLSHPGMLDTFPKEVRLVDWNYTRTSRYTEVTGCLWGQLDAQGKPIEDVRANMHDHLRVFESSIFCIEGKFDNLYSLEVLKNRGFEVMLASAVRSSGDTYFLPRTSTHIDNVGFTQEVCAPMGCDHLVTSWAVRLSHPETTWPALLATKYGQSGHIEEVTQMLGGFTQEMLEDAESAQAGIFGIDILDENITRFEKPCYGKLVESIKTVHESANRDHYYEALESRGHSADRLISILDKHLKDGVGEADVIRHWLIGLRMSRLKAWQTITILDTFTGHKAIHSLRPFIEENASLMDDFTLLWKESLPSASLNRELDVKFQRDIRILQELTTE